MTPYSFGYAVGARLEKRADVPMQMGGMEPEPQSEGWGNMLFGREGTGFIAGQQDPWQRGVVQDLALYSNPFTGVATGINDVTRHLYNGRYLNALGSVGMTGLSFIPGAGGVMGKAIGKTIGNVGTRMAANAATGGMKQMAGKALTNAGRNMTQFATRGGNIAQNINQGMSNQLQKRLPLAADPVKKTWGNYFTTRAWNEGIRNPFSAMGAADQIGGLVLPPPGAAMPPPAGMLPPPPVNQPQFRPMPFRPTPMVR